MFVRVAASVPLVSRPLLYLYYRLRNPATEAHPAAKGLGDALDYRIPARARLPWGDRVVVPCNDVIGAEILAYGCYEPVTVAVLSSLVRPGSVVIDAGAHIGQYTLLASHLAGPAGAVHSFEPSDQTFRWLTRNVRMNDRGNVTLNRCALADAAGTATYFHAPPRNPGAGSVIDRADARFTRESTVAVDSIDDYVRRHAVTRIDVMKIDVEGAEHRVLRGAARTLERDKPTLVIEFSVRLHADSRTEQELEALLRSLGYDLYLIDRFPLGPYRSGEPTGTYCNVLAVTPDRVPTMRFPISSRGRGC